MLYVPQNSFGWAFDNWGGANAYPATNHIGDTFTLKASANISGATWQELASTSEITSDVYLIQFGIGNPSSAGADRGAIIDIGVDPAGGTSYAAVVSNLVAAPIMTGNFAFNGYIYTHALPLFIKAGSSVAVRGATVVTSGDVSGAYCWFRAYGQPSAPEVLASVSQKCETLGFTSGVVGTAISCATNPNGRNYGSWASLGATTFPWRSLIAGVGCVAASGTTITGGFYFVQVGYGDATNPTVVIDKLMVVTTSNEQVWTYGLGAYPCNIPSGATLYARVRGDATNPVNQGNIHIVAVGTG